MFGPAFGERRGPVRFRRRLCGDFRRRRSWGDNRASYGLGIALLRKKPCERRRGHTATSHFFRAVNRTVRCRTAYPGACGCRISLFCLSCRCPHLFCRPTSDGRNPKRAGRGPNISRFGVPAGPSGFRTGRGLQCRRSDPARAVDDTGADTCGLREGGAAAEVRPRGFLRRQGSGVVRLCGAGRNSSVPVLGLVPSLGSCPARTVRSSPHAPVCGMIPFRGPDIPACVRSGFAPACRGPYRRRKLAARPAMRASNGVPLSMAAA